MQAQYNKMMTALENQVKVCERCGNTWMAHVLRPKQCPNCKQTAWDRPARPKVGLSSK
jgi:rubrerythrin